MVEMAEQEPKPGEMPETTTEPTPAEMVSISVVELEKIRKALKDANSESAKHRKAADDKAKSEMDEATRLKLELDQERAERLALLRETVAGKYNLPEALAKRLQGTTREELEADAASLADALPKPAKHSPGPVGGNPATKASLTMDQIKGMTPKEINANWDAVQEVLSKS